MPAVAWLVIGVCITALVMPTAAFASGALTWTGIEGQNKLKADVTASGQLMTSPADVTSAFNSPLFGFNSGVGLIGIYAPPSGEAAVITSIHVDMANVSGSDADVILDTGAGSGSESSCSFTGNVDEVDTSTDGTTVLPFSPGYVLPAGQSLCGAVGGNAEAIVSANGYLIPAADAPPSPQAPAGNSPMSIKPPLLQGQQ